MGGAPPVSHRQRQGEDEGGVAPVPGLHVPPIPELQRLPPPEVLHVAQAEPRVGVEPPWYPPPDTDLRLQRHTGHPPVVAEEPEVYPERERPVLSGPHRAIRTDHHERIEPVGDRARVPRDGQAVGPHGDLEPRLRLSRSPCRLESGQEKGGAGRQESTRLPAARGPPPPEDVALHFRLPHLPTSVPVRGRTGLE